MGEPRSFALGALAFLGLAFGLVSTTSSTTPPVPVVAHAPTAADGPVGQAVALPGAAVSGFAGSEAVRLVVAATSGQLSVAAPFAPVAVPYGYPALGVPGPALAFEGTQANVSSVVSHLRWTAAAPGPADVTVDVAPAGAAYDATTGHFFELVNGDATTWTEAADAAATSTYDGEQGYLATITTPQTEALLTRITPTEAWIGASASDGSTTWAWTTGPGADQPFWTPTCTTDPDTCPGYSNWAVAPTSPGPLVAQVTPPLLPGAASTWVTAAPDTAEATAYLVEYGGTPGDTPARLGHAAVTVNGITAPTTAPTTPTASATSTPGAVVVHWTAAAGSPTAPVDRYTVTGSPSGTCTTTGPTTSCRVNGLAPGHGYTFRVAGANAAGTGPASPTSPAAAPAYATSTTLAVAPSGVAEAGATVTLKATVATAPPGTSVPGGTVTFNDGTKALGTATIAGGHAAMTTTGLAVGHHSLQVVYGGATGFVGSTSTATPFAVTAPAATTPTAPPTTATNEPTSPATGDGGGAVDTSADGSSSPAGTASTTAIGPSESEEPSTSGADSTSATGTPTAAPALHIVFDVGVGTPVASTRATVRGHALEPGSKVTITAHSTPTLLATVVVPASGEVEQDVTLPKELADGDHRMIATGSGSGGSAVERIVPFAVTDGSITRIGAITRVPDVATATTAGRAPSAAAVAGSDAAAPASGGGSSRGPLGLPVPLLLVVLAAVLGGFLWWRSKRATPDRKVPAAKSPATTDPRSMLNPRPDRVHAP